MAARAGEDLTGFVTARQREFESSISASGGRAKGQVFTPATVARFMAGMPDLPPKRIRFLDPGAGAGMLTAAFCERLLGLRSPRSIDLVAFESDQRVAGALESTLDVCRKVLVARGHRVSVEFHARDFLETAAASFGEGDLFRRPASIAEFDIAILNPPYAKVSADFPAARLLGEVVHGQPNLYALFLAGTAKLLRAGGEMVAITPRSFCNGPYFRAFRQWFFQSMALNRLHLFDSRKDTFVDVLQESVITHAVRQPEQCSRIAISSSHGRDIPEKPSVVLHPERRIVADPKGAMVIRIPTTRHAARIIDVLDAWPIRFAGSGLGVSTGPVVSFRALAHLLPTMLERGTAPLVSVHNVGRGELRWPHARADLAQAIKVSPESSKLLLPVRNYVLLRRFTAKEEERRLVAAPFFARDWPHSHVGLENHLNYVHHRSRDLTIHEVRGLVALFNSRLFDTYFRTVSGNTQVNAAEILGLPFPPLEQIAELGRRSGEISERFLLEFLGVEDGLARELAAA